MLETERVLVETSESVAGSDERMLRGEPMKVKLETLSTELKPLRVVRKLARVMLESVT
jgi:hypothetical protein